MCIYLYYIQFIYFPVKYVVCDLQDIDSITVKFRFRGNDYKKNNWKKKKSGETYADTFFEHLFQHPLHVHVCYNVRDIRVVK